MNQTNSWFSGEHQGNEEVEDTARQQDLKDRVETVDRAKDAIISGEDASEETGDVPDRDTAGATGSGEKDAITTSTTHELPETPDEAAAPDSSTSHAARDGCCSRRSAARRRARSRPRRYRSRRCEGQPPQSGWRRRG